jgi:hypothetical protein
LNNIKEFEKCEYKTDKDIELLVLWFTPDIRKNMADLDQIINRVRENEAILKKRNRSKK